MRGLAGKAALITGAASGIGAACVGEFVRAGSQVLLVDFNQSALDGLRQVHELEPDQLVVGDVTDRSVLERAVSRARDRFGQIDIAVLNAGIGGPLKPITSVAMDDYDRLMSINLRAVFEGIQVIAPFMEGGDGGASIVLTSSINGLRAFTHTAAYTASKTGVLGLARAAANDLAAQGIRVNAVHPGFIDTPLLRVAEEALGEPESLRETWETSTPLGRVGEPREVANAVLFLASDEASFITGQSLVVDGGFSTSVFASA